MKHSLHESLWSFRDIRLVLPGRAVSYAGDSVALVALMLRVSDTGGPAAVTVLMLAFAVPMVVMIPVAGRIVDSYDSRVVLVGSSLVQAAAAVGLALVHGLAATVALVCVLQAGQAVSGPAWSALIPRIVGDGMTGRAVGTGQALSGLAMLVGSALGGLLVGWRGDRVALLVDAATFVGLGVVALAVRTRRRPDRLAVPTKRGRLAAGLTLMFDDDLLRILVPGLWLFILAAEAVNVVEVFLVTDEIGLGSSAYGVVLAFQGGGAIAGAWLAGRIDGDARRAVAVVLSTVGIGGSCVLMGLAGNVVVLVVGATGSGLSGGLLNSAVGTLVVTRSAEAVRGRVTAALNGSARACSIAALVLGGLAGQWLGPRGVFLAAGALCVLVAGLTGVRLGRSAAGKDSAVEAVSN